MKTSLVGLGRCSEFPVQQQKPWQELETRARVRKWSRNHRGMLLAGLPLPPSLLSCLSYTTQTQAFRDGAVHGWEALFHDLAIKKTPHRQTCLLGDLIGGPQFVTKMNLHNYKPDYKNDKFCNGKKKIIMTSMSKMLISPVPCSNMAVSQKHPIPIYTPICGEPRKPRVTELLPWVQPYQGPQTQESDMASSTPSSEGWSFLWSKYNS
jgi:hypothetical protein